LTLIATGFANNEMLGSQNWEKEIAKLLKGGRSEEELEVPSYARYGKRSLPGQRSR
ncbi:MAG: hypothetical protein HW402_1545, partial [Dehalococcoidales bacterium]|nr:hypothetical protein [Dehalococcoidales bacterium]